MPCNNHFISKYFLGDGAESCFLQCPLEERRNDTRVKQLFIQAAAFTRFQVVINLNDEGHCGFPWALVNPPTGCLSLAFPPAVTSQSDGRCSPRSSEPAANQGRPSSASPPPPDKKKKTIPNNYELQVERCDSSGIQLNHSWLTSVCEIPTVSPVLNARFRFSFCGDTHKSMQKKKETVSQFQTD